MSEAAVDQRLALDTLRNPSPPAGARRHSARTDASANINVTPIGAPLAELEIPRLGFTAAVLEGSDESILRRAPGHIEHTGWPGQVGNIGIAGHRDTFFRPLRHVRIGDDILLITHQGQARYRVSSVRVVSPRDVGVLDPTSEAALTLVTCYPFSFVGPAPMRYVVHAVGIRSPSPSN